MEVEKTLVLNGNESLSKALNEILRTGTAVMVTKNRKYYGIIDDRHLSRGITDASKRKCLSSAVKPTILSNESTVLERLNAFLNGHFKAIPVLQKETKKPLGLTTRADLLGELVKMRIMPKMPVSDLMSSPVYTIDHESTVGDTKKMMKQKKANKLLVVRKGYPHGLISTFDLSTMMLKPKGRPRKSPIAEVLNPDEQPIAEMLRERVFSMPVDSTVEEAAKRMAARNVSSVLITRRKKPIGVLSAVDVFRQIYDMTKEEPDIHISGLRESEMRFYPYIRDSTLDVINRFSKSFEIRNINVHVKKGKSVYSTNAFLNLKRGYISVSAEDHVLTYAIDELTRDLYRILEKRKDYKKGRKKSRKMGHK